MDSVDMADRLAKDFPFMRAEADANKAGRINDLYATFGCECGDGWYKLLHDLCTEITQAYIEQGLEPDVKIGQIKEKYGTLRFYYSSSINLDAIVDKYEELSAITCESCGQPGHLFNNGWCKVRCDSCYEEEQKPRAQLSL